MSFLGSLSSTSPLRGEDRFVLPTEKDSDCRILNPGGRNVSEANTDGLPLV